MQPLIRVCIVRFLAKPFRLVVLDLLQIRSNVSIRLNILILMCDLYWLQIERKEEIRHLIRMTLESIYLRMIQRNRKVPHSVLEGKIFKKLTQIEMSFHFLITQHQIFTRLATTANIYKKSIHTNIPSRQKPTLLAVSISFYLVTDEFFIVRDQNRIADTVGPGKYLGSVNLDYFANECRFNTKFPSTRKSSFGGEKRFSFPSKYSF